MGCVSKDASSSSGLQQKSMGGSNGDAAEDKRPYFLRFNVMFTIQW